MGWFSDDLQSGLADVLSALGERVRYVDGNTSVELTAACSKAEILAEDDNRTVVNLRVFDFLCDSADLVLDGQQIEPRRGARLIRLTLPGQPVYEVLSEKGVNQFQYSDTAQTRMRIHTLLIKR